MNFNKRLLWAGVVALLALSVCLPSVAKDDPSDHPLRVLKARYQNDSARGGNLSARGNLTIWMQNAVGVTVDGIEVEVELYNDNGRKVETLRKKIKDLGGGEKKVITFRWDVIGEKTVKPRFYVEYNRRGNQKGRFKGDSPSWQ